MCGRFSQGVIEEDLLDLFDLPTETSIPYMPPRYNGAPTQEFIACRQDNEGFRSISTIKWGLIPFWAKDQSIGSKLINARSETISEKPSFRYAFRQRRCLVPANGWFEWQHRGQSKQPYYIQLEEGLLMAFAGIWETWEGEEGILETFALLTRNAIPELAEIHHRQPVVVSRDDFDTWLFPDSPREKLIDVINAEPPGFEAWPVSPLVNNAKNNTNTIMKRLMVN